MIPIGLKRQKKYNPKHQPRRLEHSYVNYNTNLVGYYQPTRLVVTYEVGVLGVEGVGECLRG